MVQKRRYRFVIDFLNLVEKRATERATDEEGTGTVGFLDVMTALIAVMQESF